MITTLLLLPEVIVNMPTTLIGTTRSIRLVHQFLTTFPTALCSLGPFSPIYCSGIGSHFSRRLGIDKLLLSICTATQQQSSRYHQ